MDLFEEHGQIDQAQEEWIKVKYDAVMSDGTDGRCLVTILLKNFDEYCFMLGYDNRDQMIHTCFDMLASTLAEEEYIVRVHSCYFILLIKCQANEDNLHVRASSFHYAVRDTMERLYGKKLYLEMGFYPMIKEGIDFFQAKYYADLCRTSSQWEYPESNYDMYYVSYTSEKENFHKYKKKILPALEHGDFKLFLQPKVNLQTGEVTGAEALVRWVDPELGMLPIPVFLPILEETGYIREVDLYLFDKACHYMDRWVQQYGRAFQISFNLSNAYFNGQYFMPEYTEVFEKYKISPGAVQIEFLESIVLNDMERLKPLVQKIYDYGFSCALDDFGSGFSTFDILTNVELSVLKIDRSLFQNIDNRKEKTLIKHIIDIAHDMNMEAVAEGVETEAYVKYLKEIGCDYIQGFYFYKPMPIDEFEARFIAPGGGEDGDLR